MVKRIRLAIQKRGRLNRLVSPFLEKSGLEFEISERQLICSCSNFPLELLLIRHRDVLPFIESGQADIGIVGSDVYLETGCKLKKILDLGFAKSTLTLAVPKKSNIENVRQLKNKTVATTFPNLTKKYFSQQNIPVKIVTLSGSVEVAPQLDIAQAIVDLVGTGTTLRAHGLRSIAEIMEAQAVLVTGKKLSAGQQDLVDEIALRLKSVRDAVGQKYVVFNLPEKNIQKVHTIFPGLGGPSIMKVDAKKPTVDIHVIVSVDQLWKKILELRNIGASGIAVLPIENLIF